MNQGTSNGSIVFDEDMDSGRKVVLAVDTSYIAVGYILSQIGIDRKQYPSQFGLLTLLERESRYS